MPDQIHTMLTRKAIVSIIGSSQATPEELKLAEEVGEGLARQGAIIVCGGLGGVMEAACKGAQSAGGITIGILPGDSPEQANPYVVIPLATGIGYVRNIIVATVSRAVIAIGGSYGTLSEIAYALQAGRPVIGLNTWSLSRNNASDRSIISASNAAEAVGMALQFSNE